MPGPEKQFDVNEALESATSVFWKRGYQAASMSELMGAMGISKKSLYDTFGSKRELFIQALKYYSATQSADLRKELSKGESPLDNLLGLMRKWQTQAGKPNSSGCLLGTNIADFDTDDQEIAAYFREALGNIEKAFHDTLRKAIDAGELDSSTNARDLARLLVALSQGTALIGRVFETGTIPKSIGAGLLSLILKN